MPDQKRSHTRLTIDRASFERNFILEAAGRAIAVEALAAGTIETPYEVVEMICRVNELYARMVFERMLDELEPLGRADDYVAAARLHDSERSTSILVETLGEDRLMTIFPDISRKFSEDFAGLRPEDIATAELPKGAEPATLALDPTDFERFFKIDSPGYRVTREAVRQGVIGTPYEMVEMVCAANESFGKKLFDRLTSVTNLDLIAEPESVANAQALGVLLNATFGESGFDQILWELHIEVAEEFHVSLTPSRERMYEKYSLWSDALETEPS
jgi:hypothetical protein